MKDGPAADFPRRRNKAARKSECGDVEGLQVVGCSNYSAILNYDGIIAGQYSRLRPFPILTGAAAAGRERSGAGLDSALNSDTRRPCDDG